MKRAARWSLASSALAAVLGLGAGCSSGNQELQCLHPCDLAQAFRVEIAGGEQVASISVSDLCHVNGTDVVLNNGGPGAGGDPITCHVTVVGKSGAVGEMDVTATYLPNPCCAGYEFRGRIMSFTLGPADGGAGDRE